MFSEAGDLRVRAQALADVLTRRISAAESSMLFAKVALILVGGTAATIAQFLDATPPGQIPWKEVIGVCGAIAALIGGVLVIFVERDGPKLLNDARRALDDASVFLRQRDEILRNVADFKRDDLKRANLFQAAMLMREGIEHALAAGTIEVSTVADRVLRMALRHLLAAMDCEAGERWTLSVFQLQTDEAGDVLVRVVELRADRIEETQPTRSWRVGEGFAGAAFSRGGQVVVPDANDSLIASMLNIPGEKTRPDDAERYKSFAAIPIRVATSKNPWGVVVATSDKRGRFDHRIDASGHAHAEAVRLVASMLAMTVVAAHILDPFRADKTVDHNT